MKTDEIVSTLLGSSIPTYYNWKREGRLIIKLLDYFTKEELEEFIETNKIQKFEFVSSLSEDEIRKLISAEINANGVVSKLLKFRRRSLVYLYFILNNSNISNLTDFENYIEHDINKTEEKSWINFLKGIQYSSKQDYISFSHFAEEFKNSYESNLTLGELDFILKPKNKPTILHFIKNTIDNQLYKV